jgi:hypothetical protein
MKIRLQILFIIALFLSCTNKADKSYPKIDTLSGKIEQQVVKSNHNLELDSILEDYLKGYKNPYSKDTSFFVGNDTLQIKIKHYCLLDSAISLPKRYLTIYNLDSFITHNFESKIQLRKNEILILNTTIKKENFAQFLNPELVKYGALLYPEIRKEDGRIFVDYSISIPLTDVGIPVHAEIKEDGTIIYAAH